MIALREFYNIFVAKICSLIKGFHRKKLIVLVLKAEFAELLMLVCCVRLQCVHVPNGGFRRGSYRCQCRSGFYASGPDYATVPAPVIDQVATSTAVDADSDNRSVITTRRLSTAFNGSAFEHLYVKWLLSDQNTLPFFSTISTWKCLECPCPLTVGPDAALCDQSEDTTCYVTYDILLRGVPLAVQSLCVTITIVLTVVIVRLRKTKVSHISITLVDMHQKNRRLSCPVHVNFIVLFVPLSFCVQGIHNNLFSVHRE